MGVPYLTGSVQIDADFEYVLGHTFNSMTVASANGFAGSVSAAPNPVLTLSTTVTGILQGNGTAISAAPTTGSGAVALSTIPTFTDTIQLRRVAGTYGIDIVVNNGSGNTSIAATGAGAVLTIASPTLTTPDIGVARGTSLALNSSGVLYPGTTATIHGLLYIGDPTLSFQPDGAQFMIRQDLYAATVVWRSQNTAGGTAATGSSVLLQFATSTDDEEFKLQVFNLNNTQYNGPRSVFLGVDYGDFGIWSSYASASEFTGSVAGSLLTVSAMISGTLAVGQILYGIFGVNDPLANTTILSQASGTPGGVGTYNLSNSQTLASNYMTSAAPVNYLTMYGSNKGASAGRFGFGTMTPAALVDVNGTFHVSGAVSFGAYTAGVLSPTGYITITDAGGTTRRLLVG